MSFTAVYIAAAIVVPLVTLAICLIGEKIGH